MLASILEVVPEPEHMMKGSGVPNEIKRSLFAVR